MRLRTALPFMLLLVAPALAVAKGPTRAVALTAVSADAVWTLDPVDATTYWRSPAGDASWAPGARQRRPATIVARQGEVLRLVLRSFDNDHGFYLPELGVGPIELGKGETREVLVDTASIAPGAYGYLCTKARCSNRHHWMRGHLVVYPASGAFEHAPVVTDWNAPGAAPTLTELATVPAAPSLERGRALFLGKGCITCHNRGGQGGIANPNYELGTVPRLDDRASLLALFDVADGRKVIDLLAKGQELTEELLAPMELPRPQVTLTQFRNMKTVIREGKEHEGKKDPAGADPPLFMPSWAQELSDEDVNVLLGYLVSISEYDDEDPPQAGLAPLPVAELPKDLDTALARFGPPPEPPMFIGDRIVLGLLIADAVIGALFLFFRLRARTSGAAAPGPGVAA